MSSLNHPDTDQLSAYMLEPMGESSRQISLHLVDCRECRDQLKLLTELRYHLPEINTEQYQESIKTNTDFNELLMGQNIEAYIDRGSDDNSGMRLKSMLQENGMALKAALHYVSHSACMQREMSPNSPTVTASVKRLVPESGTQRGFLSVVTQWLFSRPPVWMAIPATAALAGLLAITVLPLVQKPDIITYQDNPVIQFKHAKDLPGIGFFANADKQIRPYGGVKASLLDKNFIQLQWPVVQDATSYTIHLKIFKLGQQISVGKMTSTEPRVSFQRADQDTGHRYVWKLHGKTTKGELFSSSGGFIIQPD